RQLLGDIVDLVRQTSRCGVEGQPPRIGLAKARADRVESFVPSYAVEAFLPTGSHHRPGEPAQLAELSSRHALQDRDVAEHFLGRGWHGIEAQQPQTGEAEVDAFDRVVAQTPWSERAAIADPVV